MSRKPLLTFHGAARTVTGSCVELELGGRRLLIDCGLFQGTRTLETLNREPFAFDPRTIDAVVLTHAHIDHSGLLPRLIAEGFGGRVWCTGATRDLLAALLPDSGRIHESEAERRNRRPDRRDDAAFAPIYTEAQAVAALGKLHSVELGAWFEPAPGYRARLWNAGHILGSASIELVAGDSRLLFSGDLGPDEKSFYADPDAPEGFDHVVCESTYGDRDRPETSMDERRALLEHEIKAALGQGGNLVVPVFAVERTQELLADIALLINAGRLPHVTVFIDSPLAERVTNTFAAHAHALADLGTGEIFRHPAFHYVEDAQQSMRLNGLSGAIILAASGMCEAGRIRHHLRHNLPRSDSTVLFVGFQAAGTLGRTLLDGVGRVRISGRDVTVKARIRRIDTYSAHADRAELLRWIAARAPIRGSLFLNHGESAALAALRAGAEAGDKRVAVVIPEIGEQYELGAGEQASRRRTGRLDLLTAVEADWQNDYADFAVNLKRELKEIDEPKARREALRRMRDVLSSYARHRRRDGS